MELNRQQIDKATDRIVNGGKMSRDELFEFSRLFNRFADHVCLIAHEHGFWSVREHMNIGEKLALIHSEISETLEALRKDPATPSDKIPDFRLIEEELADAIIRIADLGPLLQLNLGDAIIAKSQYNEGRPYLHGKKF